MGVGMRRSVNRVRNRLDESGNGNILSMLDCPEEFGQSRLGLRSSNLTHVDSNLLL